ncbi:MAG: YggT family protein [Anaerolineales bacterium]|nr:YggT family protein [Anaerolineales bacterium]NUQ84126.1 YggT family protein [Anaerolineales bacterium]
MIFLAQLISMFANIYVWIVIASILLSYFMDPYHPVRQGVDNLVRPLLDPIRRVVPPVGMIDFSPLVLIILIQVVANLLVRFLYAIS